MEVEYIEYMLDCGCLCSLVAILGFPFIDHPAVILYITEVRKACTADADAESAASTIVARSQKDAEDCRFTGLRHNSLRARTITKSAFSVRASTDCVACAQVTGTHVRP